MTAPNLIPGPASGPPGPSVSIDAAPWWSFGIVWLVIGGPLIAVVFSVSMGITAWRHADIELKNTADAETIATGDAATLAARAATQPTAPAELGRNHAATPRP